MKRLTIYLIMLFLIGSIPMHASITELQEVKVSLDIKNQKLKNVFSLLEKKAGYAIVYEEGIIDLDQKVDLVVNNESVDEVLDKLVAQTGHDYTFINSQIVITKKINRVLNQQQAPKKITGQVFDENKEPIIGASVTVEGTTTGTFTDLDGKFELTLPAGSKTVIAKYLGYQDQKVAVENQTSLFINLIPDDQGLDEVVVIGYGTVKKRDLTGSVASVKSDEITQIPTSNALEAIQGKVPGMDITREGGSAGAGVKIIIRGTKTLGYTDETGKVTRGTDPLFIIDGVQGGSYEDLNPSDIESIDVLKDASSTAIYGSLGANGVVIITTKKGKTGKINVSYNGHYGVNGWVDYPKPRMGEDYINLRREAYRTVGEWNSSDDDINIFAGNTQQYEAYKNNQWVNWIDLVTRNGHQQNHNITFSSGTENLKSFISLTYFNEEGVFKRDNMNRYSLRMNIDYSVNKWLKAGVNSQITYTETNNLPTDDSNNAFGSMLTNAMTYVPLGSPYNEDGSINIYPVAGDQSSISPLANYVDKYKAKNNTISSKIFAVGYIEVQPIKQLKWRSNLSTALNFSRLGVYNGQYSLDQHQKGWTNEGYVTNRNTRFYSWDNIITYNESFGDHNLEVTGITTWTKEQKERYRGRGENQLLDSPGFYNMGMFSASQSLESQYIQKQTMGFAGRISYNYKSKYLITATGRYDGSSVLASNKRWSFFPSISGAWRASDEAFMELTKGWMNDLKVRISYGTSGNAIVPPYAVAGGSGTISNKFGFNNTGASVLLLSPSIENKELGWEKSYTTNIGLDLGFLQNRITATFDFYNIDTKDGIFARKLRPSAGAGGSSSNTFYQYQNIAEINNKGFEFAITSNNINNKDFRWSTTLTFATNKEKITKLITKDEDLIDPSNPEKSSLLIGRPVNSFYSYKIDGIWQIGEEEEMAKYKLDGKENAFKPGDIKVRDMDGDFNITTKDRTYLGHASPTWSGGLSNSFYYKGFDLNIYMIMRWGQMIDAQFLGRYDPSGVKNSPAYLDYWTPENPSNDFPRPMKGAPLSNYYGYMSLNYVDGSYFKIKNISLGYTVPRKLTENWGISNLKFYVTASNLLTISKSHLIKHYDPERGGDEKSPLAKQLVFGVNLSF